MTGWKRRWSMKVLAKTKIPRGSWRGPAFGSKRSARERYPHGLSDFRLQCAQKASAGQTQWRTCSKSLRLSTLPSWAMRCFAVASFMRWCTVVFTGAVDEFVISALLESCWVSTTLPVETVSSMVCWWTSDRIGNASMKLLVLAAGAPSSLR